MQQVAVAQLSVSAVGLNPLKYQWFKDGEIVRGSERFSLNNYLVNNDAGSYDVEISNNLGSLRSNAVSINVIEPPIKRINTSDCEPQGSVNFILIMAWH